MRRIAVLCILGMWVAAGAEAASAMVPTKRAAYTGRARASTHGSVHRRTKSTRAPMHQRAHYSTDSQSGADPLLLGNGSVLSQGDSDTAGQAEAIQQTATTSGTVESISLYVAPNGQWSGAPGPTVVLGLYSDNNGKPGTLLTSGSAAQKAKSWATATVPKVSVTAGTRYWLALLSPSGSVYYFTSPTANCGDVGSTQTNLRNLPSSFSTGPSWGICPASIHADGIAGGPPAPQPPAPHPPAPPSNMAAPTISGTPQQGDTLTASQGTWSGDTPMSYSYRWSDGVTGQADTLSSADVGKNVSVTVTAADDGGSASATSASAGPVTAPPPAPAPVAPSNTAAPTISGTAQQGDTLTASSGSWWGDTPMSYTYKWSDGATGQSHTLSSADVGKNVSVTVTATNDGGSASATSASVGPVTAPPPPPAPVAPSNTAAPTISGTAQQGDTLTASSGSWSGDTPMSYTYKWSDGATGQADTLSSADVGKNVSVTVTATNDAGNSSATSQSVGPVTAQQQQGNCTVTVSSVSNVNADLTPGAVVCLTAGIYGSLSITASPSSNATVTAAPAAHVVVAGVNLSGSNITVSQLHSTGGITINNGGSNDTIDHNDVTEAKCGYGIAVFGVYTGSSFNPVANHDTISWNKIHDTGTTCEADALRIQGYANITIVHNDEYNLADPNQYHTDTLQSYQAGVPTSGLVYSYNYAHDLANAGPPFLKDGDVQNVTITDNLVVRNTWTGIGGMDLHENTSGLVFRNNTYLGTSGTVVQGQGSAPNPSLLFDHNVIDNANQSGSTGYTITSDYNDFVENDEYAWPLGAHDTRGTPAGGYKCGSSCGSGTAAGDDYELANNPNGIGIDWNPANQAFGPAN
jgi:hypothetical protein